VVGAYLFPKAYTCTEEGVDKFPNIEITLPNLVDKCVLFHVDTKGNHLLYSNMQTKKKYSSLDFLMVVLLIVLKCMRKKVVLISVLSQYYVLNPFEVRLDGWFPNIN
jgi:hypothetical protein